jgi:allantoinase
LFLGLPSFSCLAKCFVLCERKREQRLDSGLLRLCNQGDSKDYATYLATRPASWEQNAIRGLLGALEADVDKHGPAPSGFGLHIAHLADAESIEMIQARIPGCCEPPATKALTCE